MKIEQLDRMRKALAECTFLPGSSHKRFVRQVAQTYLDKVTDRQWRHVIRLAWRYRRQMPLDLVPSKDAVEAMDGRWAMVEIAGLQVFTTTPEPEKKPARAPKISPQGSLFERREQGDAP